MGGLLDDPGSDEDDEDLSGLPPELKQLREKERRSANNAREVSCNAKNLIPNNFSLDNMK